MADTNLQAPMVSEVGAPATSAPPAIALVGVNKIYGSEVKTQVLYDVDLAFAKGSFASIVGSSGSGKSTLLQIMGTLDTPSSGEVTIDGRQIGKLDRRSLASLRNLSLGFIFQFHYLLPEFTALENVLMPYRISGRLVTDDVRRRAGDLLDIMGLAGVKNNLSTRMSGGQQQRTAIARALINSPSIVLADEPTGNLDSDSTESIYRTLRDINERLGTTFIVITHDRRIAEKTDRIVEVKDGRIALDIRA